MAAGRTAGTSHGDPGDHAGEEAGFGAGAAVLMALAPERISESLRVCEEIPADEQAPARARALLSRVADTVDLSLRLRIDLVLTDLICRRGLDSAGSGHSFHVEVARAPARVRVELIEDLPAPDPGTGAPAGHELQLVAELADRWGLSFDGAASIWFEIELTPDV